jgi:hypothetical protein
VAAPCSQWIARSPVRNGSGADRSIQSLGVMNGVRCIGCGGYFEPLDGPTHAYMESSPGCWAAYGLVLAREYSNREYMTAHRLTVDTYAVQHPGRPSRRTSQSVGAHLIALYVVLELDEPVSRATAAIRKAVETVNFDWLEPPHSRGSITVADVLPATTAGEHLELVRKWARAAWEAWAPHHRQIRAWAVE